MTTADPTSPETTVEEPVALSGKRKFAAVAISTTATVALTIVANAAIAVASQKVTDMIIKPKPQKPAV